MSGQAKNVVLKSVPPENSDARALEKIQKAHDAKLEAEESAANAKRVLADARKERLDELTECKENLKSVINAAKGAGGKDSNKHLKSVIDANEEWEETASEHDEKVRVAKEAFESASKALDDANGRLKETITNSKQGELFD